MSTFLELCVKTRRNCLIPGEGPSDVTTQEGELNELVNYVADAYLDVQNRRSSWRWLRRDFTFNTTAEDGIYEFGDVTDVDAAAVISRFSKWHIDDVENPPKVYLNSAGIGGERWLIYTPWQWFNTIYGIGTQNSGPPVHITIDPQDRIRLGPVPDDIFTITGEFFRSAQILAADDELPEMPSQYHDLIVYLAMQKYGMGEAAAEVVSRGNQEARRILRQLELNQMPQVRLARPLA